MPRVSVLLPTHNRCDVLGFAIRSALAQTFQDFELIVMGDGCTDDTAAVVQSFVTQASTRRIVWLDFPKAPGFGYANRNRALRHARGEIIAYLAHDDLWFPDHLQRLVECLSRPGAELTYSLPLTISESGQVTPLVLDLHDPSTLEMWRAGRLPYLYTTAVAHLTRCLTAYGFWQEEMPAGGDWELWVRILAGGQWRNVVYHPVPTSVHFVAHWRRGSETWSRRLWQRVRAWERSVPPELSLHVPPGTTEQEAVWLAIERAPSAWMSDLRAAVQIDLDRRATFAFPLSGALEAGSRYFQRLRGSQGSQGAREPRKPRELREPREPLN